MTLNLRFDYLEMQKRVVQVPLSEYIGPSKKVWNREVKML